MKSQTLKIKLSGPMREYIESMIRTGLYGETPEEVSAELIRDGILRSISAKIIGLRNY